ncbi:MULTISPECIES: hypothetical protein [Bacillus cereus group]|uniref:Lipoprotein n=2 Tax=Bacillus cereus group TaxID=86661 RepID=A0AAW5L7P4_BACCE|nr:MULTISPECIES: hypothetical protein [Bacillus cereus group]MCQ6288589.1 hypothetical protein [Bacillus cereus]MCQ6317911.1 hypothetical protein [Bacillus cereus]MCQ6329106.1 hypothetical protein [Bacillus cereus]MCQ6385768.1 hypothetical protein [Bacillus cereus]PFT89348.1 hypothetical protein COK81_17230 [Bacillus thuringiensis]
MFKRISILGIIGALSIYLTGCASNTPITSTSPYPIDTPYKNEDLTKAFPVGMPIDNYISKKNILPVQHISSIPLANGNIGRVLQAKDGFVIICGNEKEIFDVKTFKKWGDVQIYENSIQKHI